MKLSLRQKILYVVGGSTSVLLVISAIWLVSHIARLSQQAIEAEAHHYTDAETLKISAYFSQYANTANTFIHSPTITRFLQEHTQRGAAFNEVPNYPLVNQTFKQISEPDVNVLSAFIASNITEEYFREDDRTGVPTASKPNEYFVTKRPWYQNAIKKPGIFVGAPSADLTTGIISAVVQGPIRVQGQLLGVGGVDLNLDRIAALVEDVRFQNEGFGILVDENKGIVHLSKRIATLDNRDESKLKVGTLINDLDTVLADTSGFNELAKRLFKDDSQLTPITLQGKSYYVTHDPIHMDYPQMQWSLVLLIPAQIVDKPVQNAVMVAVFGVLFILAVLVAVLYLVASKITRPLAHLNKVMGEIANGDGDLTRQVPITSDDEVGELGDHVNSFIGKLRNLLKQTAQQSELLGQAANELTSVSQATNQEIQEEKQQVDSVTAAVTEMACSAVEISNNANQTSQAAENVEKQTHAGLNLSTQAGTDMANLRTQMEKANEVVTGLAQESNKIGSVVDVINGIAEQTNLLALNAAIEAARAGEQGRGFAVVADEVRSLASRTQESTKDIRNMVQTLQQRAQQAHDIMQQGQQQAITSAEKAALVQKSLQEIAAAVKVMQEYCRHIAVATSEQQVVAEDVNRSLHHITELVQSTASHAEQLAHEAKALNGGAKKLNDVVGHFKL